MSFTHLLSLLTSTPGLKKHTHTSTLTHSHTHCSVFKVTTPEKKAKSRPPTDSVQEEEEEEEEEEVDGSSKASSPEELRDYLKTTFESLSSDKAADAFFARSPPNPRDLRLSISARFFSQSSK